MSDRMMVHNLRHERSSLSDEAFFEHVDACGGWPLGYQYVGFEHSDQRAAGFCNSPRNTGWWTVLASADDYYLWKLSPAALQRIADAAISATTVSRVSAERLHIKNFMGYNAARAKPVIP